MKTVKTLNTYLIFVIIIIFSVFINSCSPSKDEETKVVLQSLFVPAGCYLIDSTIILKNRIVISIEMERYFEFHIDEGWYDEYKIVRSFGHKLELEKIYCSCRDTNFFFEEEYGPTIAREFTCLKKDTTTSTSPDKFELMAIGINDSICFKKIISSDTILIPVLNSSFFTASHLRFNFDRNYKFLAGGTGDEISILPQFSSAGFKTNESRNSDIHVNAQQYFRKEVNVLKQKWNTVNEFAFSKVKDTAQLKLLKLVENEYDSIGSFFHDGYYVLRLPIKKFHNGIQDSLIYELSLNDDGSLKWYAVTNSTPKLPKAQEDLLRNYYSALQSGNTESMMAKAEGYFKDKNEIEGIKLVRPRIEKAKVFAKNKSFESFKYAVMISTESDRKNTLILGMIQNRKMLSFMFDISNPLNYQLIMISEI